jgi:Na+-transporting NADH:ubiquinone oxidoreductase subunit NqrB
MPSIHSCTLPNEITHNGTHIKAADDLKRTMNTVIMAYGSMFNIRNV